MLTRRPPTHTLQNSTLFTNVGSISYDSVSTSRADVYLVNGYDVTDASTIQAFVAAGGGVIVGNHVWGFSGPDARAPVNALLIPMGIFVSSSIVWVSGTPLDVSPTTEPSQVANSASGLPCLQASLLGNISSACYQDTDAAIAGSMTSLASSAAVTPWGTSFWRTLATVGCMSAHDLSCCLVCLPPCAHGLAVDVADSANVPLPCSGRLAPSVQPLE